MDGPHKTFALWKRHMAVYDKKKGEKKRRGEAKEEFVRRVGEGGGW